jgi:hypothetical protein
VPESIRLYLDEDAQRTALVRALRARQVDVLTANEAGKTGDNDSDQLAYAASLNRTLFTFNRGDFVRLHVQCLKQGQDHSGIIVSDQLELGVVIRRLLRLIDARSAEDMKNWLEFLSSWR